ncbi:Flagellar biosynthesis protein FlhA (plasmid) [Sinorhizobium sojae CCBAU 05684]|uniref:Flagellar biosynthesis protein FlhA n=1 Tax=Sinorhizobium sojae CCBAU 05684 TaxID=716928 RepID=A0A249PJ35_9HYPH|nr:flagellar biosynthesis protein FlhA [Sinorhizobium sojae]ASY65757.1 Flagellar biosynthesis protein FlhA [Sinorhizobium sojae CCBAU 05684]
MDGYMPPLSALSRRTDILFAVFFLVIVAMMVLPLPTVMVDAMIAFNLAFAFIVLVTTIYLRNVLDISTFPAVILIGTIFRLALTISTTRLVLATGDAGEIIAAFGSFVVAGNVVVGLVVFLIVALVQFIVVTKGAERIAEVGARFTLDAMPGKQLAIDSDLRNGHITAEAAQKRRSQLERESQFFGAMDGAMRFVKGDAIAGLIIVAVNLIGGLAIGIFQRGLSFSESLQLYSLLSVGDGLVSQIPSMLMAVAAGTVVTRVSDEGNSSLGVDIGRQLAREPRALAVAAAMTALISFVPGLPDLVLWPIAGLLGFLSFSLWRRRKDKDSDGAEAPATASHPHALDRTKYGDPIIATVSSETLARLEADGLASLLDNRIRVAARAVGVAITVPTFNADPRMGNDLIHIQVENVPAGLVHCPKGRPADKIASDTVRIVRRHIGSIFSVDDVTQWLTSLEPRLGKLASDVREQVSPMLLVAVIRRLLDSGVTLSQPRGLLETMLNAQQSQAPEDMAERARQALGSQIAFGLLDQRGLLPVITLGAEWERAVRAFKASSGGSEAEAREKLRRLTEEANDKLSAANAEDRDPVAIVGAEIRLLSQALLIRHGCRLPVLSSDEISPDITCDVIAAVGA